MGLLKNIARVATDVVDVELQVLPGVLQAVTPGVLKPFTGAFLAATPRSLTKRSFEGKGLPLRQLRAVNFQRFQQGLPLITQFGVETKRGGLTDVLLREDIQQARRAANLLDRPRVLGSPLPDFDRRLLRDNPFLPEVTPAERQVARNEISQSLADVPPSRPLPFAPKVGTLGGAGVPTFPVARKEEERGLLRRLTDSGRRGPAGLRTDRNVRGRDTRSDRVVC